LNANNVGDYVKQKLEKMCQLAKNLWPESLFGSKFVFDQHLVIFLVRYEPFGDYFNEKRKKTGIGLEEMVKTAIWEQFCYRSPSYLWANWMNHFGYHLHKKIKKSVNRLRIFD
jgi:hypothetical protein